MPDPLTRHFRSAELAASFRAAYDAQLARWPMPVSSEEVSGAYGRTRVQACGPSGGPSVFLLHGRGCTSTTWYANVPALSGAFRCYAPDQMGDAGMSAPSDRPMRRIEDYVTWLDGLLDGLGISATAYCGHSYGAWLALNYALYRPDRVTRLVLIDPTECFAGLRSGYVMHALPVLARPSSRRTRGFLEWETGGVPLDPSWLTLTCLGGEFRGARFLRPRPPAAQLLRALKPPALVLLAGKSKAHDIAKVRRRAEEVLPQPAVRVLPRATHHTLPATNADQLNAELARFLGGRSV